jgi:hypothetical protein
MKKLIRISLPALVAAYLQGRGGALAARSGGPKQVERAWKQARQTMKIKQAVQILIQMNGGHETCMYCEHNESTDIEHFCPCALQPQGTFHWDNLNYACHACNKRKHTQFPPGLLNPTDPSYHFEQHFALNHLTGQFNLLSPQAQTSEPVYALNRGFLKNVRQRRFTDCQNTIIRYADCHRQNNLLHASLQQRNLQEFSPATVFETIKQWYHGRRRTLLEPECVQALQTHPEILSW